MKNISTEKKESEIQAVLSRKPPVMLVHWKLFVYRNRLWWDIIASGFETASNVLSVSDTCFEVEWRIAAGNVPKPPPMADSVLVAPWFLTLPYYQLCALYVFPFADEMHVTDPGYRRRSAVGIVFLGDVVQVL